MRLLRRLRAGLPDRDAQREERDRRRGRPSARVVTTCAYCGVGCAFKAEVKGDEVVRMVPYKAGKANEGHSCVKGRFAYGYATHKDRIAQADDPRADRGSVARSVLGRGDRLRGGANSSASRRNTAATSIGAIILLALHQRGGVPRPEAGARGLRQQQRRHLRARLPFADRLRPLESLRHVGGHAGFQVGRQGGRGHGDRRQSDRRPPGVRLAPQEAPARRRAG